jgi:hypothetical protein
MNATAWVAIFTSVAVFIAGSLVIYLPFLPLERSDSTRNLAASLRHLK